jgi:hypothetical protein
MRIATKVSIVIPNISRELSTKILENFGVSISKSGFIGLPEDLDFLFSQDFSNTELADIISAARIKWEDGDIAYV